MSSLYIWEKIEFECSVEWAGKWGKKPSSTPLTSFKCDFLMDVSKAFLSFPVSFTEDIVYLFFITPFFMKKNAFLIFQ